jgi:hypothetical protein
MFKYLFSFHKISFYAIAYNIHSYFGNNKL